jgi:putative membrane protein
MRQVIQANLAEIAAGKLAHSRSKSSAVRSYARRMVREHGMLQREASELRSVQGMPLPTSAERSEQAELRKLAALSGEAFDRAYLGQSVERHDALLPVLERIAARSADPVLQAHAERAIPHLRRHRELARHAACTGGRHLVEDLCGTRSPASWKSPSTRSASSRS